MENAEIKIPLSLPEVAFIAGTRALIGAGLGLLIADRLKPEQRKVLALSIFSIGALSTIPIGYTIFKRRRHERMLKPTLN